MHTNRYGQKEDRDGIAGSIAIDGRRYRLEGVDTHEGARDGADHLRSMGYHARIRKCSRGRYAIYVRD